VDRDDHDWLRRARQEGCAKGTAVGPRQSEVLAGLAVRHSRSAPTLPTDPEPLVELVEIDVSRQRQQARGDEFLASPGGARNPAIGDGFRAFRTRVVATLSHLTNVINQRLQFGPFRGEQRFAAELGGQGLVFGGHAQVCRYTAHARASHLREFYRQANSEDRNEVSHDRKH
jgi:hypothetical protein